MLTNKPSRISHINNENCIFFAFYRKSGDQPTIKIPEKYAGRTLERHLQLYDWRNEYDTFDRIIKTSQFDGICNSAVVSSRVSSHSLINYSCIVIYECSACS